MALASLSNGTQSATVTTEHSLVTNTSARRFQLMVDLNNMVNGDVLELRLKTKVLSGGTGRVAWYAVFSNAQAVPIVVSPVINSPYSLEATLKQTAGTSRNFDWSLIDCGVIDPTADIVLADAVKISGDTTAADKLESWLDGMRTGTAQAGAAGTITLDAGASASDNFYQDTLIVLAGGTGAGQVRWIKSYVGSTKVATVEPNWVTNPDNTSVFVLWPSGRVNLGGWLGTTPLALQSQRVDSYTGAMANDVVTAAAVAADAIGSSELAASAITEIQSGLSTLDAAGVRTAVGLASANLDTQLGAIDDYLDTEVAAIKAKTDNLPVSPAATGDIPSAASIADAVWDEARSGHVGAGSFGEGVASVQGNVTGAVASVTGAVGSVTGSIGSLGATAKADVNAEVDTALADANLDHLVGTATGIPAVPAGTFLDQLMDDGTAAYDRTTDSLQAIRDRGDAAWTTGGGGSITDSLNIVPLIPPSVDLANTATFRLALMLTNALDDLPTTVEITPGTISIERKAIGGTGWSAVVTDAACSEANGQVYYDAAFNSGAGYAEGDSLRITFKSQKITVAANDYEVSDTTGRMFFSEVRQTERGTNGAYTGTPPTAVQIRQEMDANSTKLDVTVGSRSTLDAAGVQTAMTSQGYTPARAGYLDTLNGLVAAIWDRATGLLTAAGSIGKLLVDSLDVTVGSRASQTSVNTLTTYVDTEVAAIKAKTDLLPANPAAASDIPTAIANADALLKRDLTAVTGEAARSPLNALRFLRNRWRVNAGTLTVYKEDDTTAAWTAPVTTNASADPITEVDPS